MNFIFSKNINRTKLKILIKNKVKYYEYKDINQEEIAFKKYLKLRKEESKKPEDQNRRPHSRRDPRDNKKPAEREARDGKKSQSQRRRRFRKGRGPNPAQKAQQKKKEP